MNMPSPLVPAHIDLRDFQFMPLDVVRLRDSSLAMNANGNEFRAAVMLWCAAWHQVPAGSLPSDECNLATFAGYGRRNKLKYDKVGWGKVREGALRGFKTCSDGRLYHTVIAEKALEAWEGKLKLRFKRECERIRKASHRADTTPSYPSFDEWKQHIAITGDDKWEPLSHGTDSGQTPTVPSDVHPLRDRRQGQETGDRGQETALAPTLLDLEASTQGTTGEQAIALACSLMEQASGEHVNPSREDLVAAIAEGVSAKALADTVREALASPGKPKTSPIAWAISTARKRKAGTNGTKPARKPAKSPEPEQQAIEPKPQKVDRDQARGILAGLRERMGWT